MERAVPVLLCFFKQKTAYEITYGDWSSDVCSSDLTRRRVVPNTSAPASGSARPCPSRSEEHTSELQSPYVISYAVFCLKKTIHRQIPCPKSPHVLPLTHNNTRATP